MKNARKPCGCTHTHTHTHTHTYSLWEGGNGLNYISLLLLRGGGAR